MKRVLFFAVVCGLLMAGCAGSTAEGCASTDWYRQGYVDGQQAFGSMFEEHVRRCAAFGVQPDAAKYQTGWKDGYFIQLHRVAG